MSSKQPEDSLLRRLTGGSHGGDPREPHADLLCTDLIEPGEAGLRELVSAQVT
jgi:hypothetical protein